MKVSAYILSSQKNSQRVIKDRRDSASLCCTAQAYMSYTCLHVRLPQHDHNHDRDSQMAEEGELCLHLFHGTQDSKTCHFFVSVRAFWFAPLAELFCVGLC